MCGKKDGYMTMALNRTFVHKQCARSLPGAIYNEFLSYIKPTADMQYQKIPRPCFEDNCEDQIEVPLVSHLRSHIEYIVPPLQPQSGLSCSVCHMRRGRVVRCGYTGCTRQFHLSCIRPYICVCFPTSTGLFIRCSEHLPQDYRFDQQLNAIVPVGSTTLQTSLSDLVSSLRKYRAEWEKLHGRIVTQSKESRQLLESKKIEVVRYYKRKMHFCSILSSYILQVEKSMMEPWMLTQQGFKTTENLMVTLSDGLKDYIPSSVVLGVRKADSNARERKSNSSELGKSKRVYRGKKKSKHNVNSWDIDESSARNSDDEFVPEDSSDTGLTKRISSRFKHRSNRQVQHSKKEGETKEKVTEEPIKMQSKEEETVREAEIKEIVEEAIEKVVEEIGKETEESTVKEKGKEVVERAEKPVEKAGKEKQEHQGKRTKEKEKLVIQTNKKEEAKVEKQEKLTEKEGKKQEKKEKKQTKREKEKKENPKKQEKKEKQKNLVKQTKSVKQSRQSKRVAEAKEMREAKEREKKEKQKRKMSYQAKRLRAKQLVDEWLSNELLQKQLAAERRRRVEERRQQTLMKREEAKQRELEVALLHYVTKANPSAKDTTDKVIQQEPEGISNETSAAKKTSMDSPKKSLKKSKEVAVEIPKKSSKDAPKENKGETPKKIPKKSAKEIPKMLSSVNSIGDSKNTKNTPNKPRDSPHDISPYYLNVMSSLPAGMQSWLLHTDDDHKGHPLSRSEQLIYNEKTKYESIADRSMAELSTVFYPHTAKLSSKSLAIVRIISRFFCLDAFL